MASLAAVGMAPSPPTGALTRAADPPKAVAWSNLLPMWKASARGGGFGSSSRVSLHAAAAAPEGLSGKVEESIKHAKEACSEDPASGECAAAWDEVEELSAAASHARDRVKDSDPLETYCKDNPETEECRTYED